MGKNDETYRTSWCNYRKGNCAPSAPWIIPVSLHPFDAWKHTTRQRAKRHLRLRVPKRPIRSFERSYLDFVYLIEQTDRATGKPRPTQTRIIWTQRMRMTLTATFQRIEPKRKIALIVSATYDQFLRRFVIRCIIRSLSLNGRSARASSSRSIRRWNVPVCRFF